MTKNSQAVPTARSDYHPQVQKGEADAVDIFVHEFGHEAGKRVGSALAEEIHNDPAARRAAATGVGVGVGVVVGLGLLALLTQ